MTIVARRSSGPQVSSWCWSLARGPQRCQYFLIHDLFHFDVQQPNILMSNDTPPRACLADFGFMSMVLDPIDPMACCAQLEGGTKAFMSPELLVPSKFGFKDSGPTPHADIYAFGMVIFQVCRGIMGLDCQLRLSRSLQANSLSVACGKRK